MDKACQILLAAIFFISGIVICLSVQQVSCYFHNQQYNVERKQNKWKKEWPKSIEKREQYLLSKGLLLSLHEPKRKEVISHEVDEFNIIGNL